MSNVLTSSAPTDGIKGPDERAFGRSARLVLTLALALLTLSVAQKAYRLSLPTDGWRTSNANFESDEPLYLENLSGLPSPLQPGDRLTALEGESFTDLELQSFTGRTTDIGYDAGETVRYTVLREGKKLDLQVPLYPGNSIGPEKIFPLLFTQTQVGNALLWIAVAIGAFVFWKRPANLTAQLLFLQLMVTASSAVSWLVSPLAAADILHPGTFYVAAFFTHWIHALLEQPLGLHLILSFPLPAGVLQRRWTLPLLYGLPLAAFALIYVLPDGNGAPLFMLVVLYNLFGIVLVVRMFFRYRDPVAQAQVRWFGFGYAISNLGTLLFALWAAGLVSSGFHHVTEALPFNTVFLLCTTVAILRYRLFDIDVILNRTLVWGGLSALVIGVYALVVGTLGHLVGDRLDLGVSLLATGLIALLFQPLRTFLQHRVNRLLYGKRDEPYTVLAELLQRSGTAALPVAGLSATAETVAQALKLPYVAVALPGETTPLAAYGRRPRETAALPLTFGTTRVGELQLGLRLNEQRFSTSEYKLLEAIAQQTSAVAYAALLTQGLQRSREQLVTTREEERRRLRRDLHDGLGPTLASLTLRLDLARTLVRQQPEAAETLLTELKGQTQEALADIRRLVYALRPPALDELGLLGALRALGETLGHPNLDLRLELPPTLPPLSAATEVALYRIAQEGLANVVHHAGATRADLELRVGEDIVLSVNDNGVGIHEASKAVGNHAGVGLQSVRERAEELGGSLALTTNTPTGTCVRVRLPLATNRAGDDHRS